MSVRTFLPSGMAARSTSTLAMAKTSAEADMLTRKSGASIVSQPSQFSFPSPSFHLPVHSHLL
jgi:hypothetical protein